MMPPPVVPAIVGTTFLGRGVATIEPSMGCGVTAPRPVAKTETIEPGCAGFAGELMLPSWLRAAACVPSAVNTPGAAVFTPRTMQLLVAPLYEAQISVERSEEHTSELQ